MNPQAALDLLDQVGPLLNAAEMARLWQITPSQFYKLAKQGAFVRFEVKPPIGPRRYSKAIVARYLAGEEIDAPSRVFGRRRSA